MSEHHEHLRGVARRQWRVAVSLTALMVVIYFGFILLIAWQKPLMGRLVTPGLSVGILLGALVIVAAWLLTLGYVRWANRSHDADLRRGRSA